MASKKFTCEDCGSTFTGGPATKTCPDCGSSMIKVGGSGKGIPGWTKIATIAVVVIIIIILLLRCCGSKDISATLIEDLSSINIEMTGVGKGDLNNYCVQVLIGTDVVETIKFLPKKNMARFDKMRMLVGTCYNFRIYYCPLNMTMLSQPSQKE